jgi:hypothetical protein
VAERGLEHDQPERFREQTAHGNRDPLHHGEAHGGGEAQPAHRHDQRRHRQQETGDHEKVILERDPGGGDAFAYGYFESRAL